MKKTLLFAIMAAALGFAACSKEDPAKTEAPREGMILRVTVEQPSESKATFTDNEGVWHFDFAKRDKITVTNKEISTDYTFSYNGTDFTSADARPASKPTRWYAYYPSKNVSFVGQTGKWEDLANVYAMVGYTPYGSDVTGEDGLDITMEQRLAILKIINNKGDIDINVKNSETTWVTGVKAILASFVPVLDETKQTLLSTTERGTYYVVVPSGIQLVIKDGDKTVKSTGPNGLKAGMYYEIDMVAPTIGTFSVSANRKVHFSRGNLYWNGNSFELETRQYDMPVTWDPSHVSLFYWSKNASVAYAPEYSDTGSDKDVFFTNATPESANPNFTVSGETGKYRTLSQVEWKYLLSFGNYSNDTRKGRYKHAVNVCGITNCVVIAPDNWDISKNPLRPSYDAKAWEAAEAAGLVCLPAAGDRTHTFILSVGAYGYCWASSSNYPKDAYMMSFNKDNANPDEDCFRSHANSVRLVTDQ